ncbi:hypothetical protein NMY22_g3280 [Coprinellus aureogranulatus]|nr:hypothetical protein NMY22_g3280 [Coprinellus aureogranulatus]
MSPHQTDRSPSQGDAQASPASPTHRRTTTSTMGARHQLFLVARVRKESEAPKEYRCVAAFHRQWCSGTSPLLCVHRFRLLARVKSNADLIQRDLDMYHLGLQRSSEFPCPYISFLAGMAFSIDLEQRHLTWVSYLPASTGSTDRNNDAGITIIDISTPNAPKYCFAGLAADEAYALLTDENASPKLIPLTATQYMKPYNLQSLDPLAGDATQKEQALNDKAIGCLADMPVLTMDVLAETWPHEYEVDPVATSYGNPAVDNTIGAVPSPALSTSQTRLPLESIVKSLKALTDCVVNLANCALLPEDLLDILSSLPPFTRLDISRNAAIDKATLSQVLQKYRLKWVNIDECGVSADDMIDLLTSQASLFRGTEAVIHPIFLSLENLVSWDAALKIEPLRIPCVFRFSYNIEGHLALPFFGTDQLIQALMNVADAHHGFEPYTRHIFFPTMQCLFGSMARSGGQPWGERTVQMIPMESRGVGSVHEYRFIFISGPWGIPNGGDLPPISIMSGVHHYGILLPGGERKFVDLATFFGHLEEAGWPAPTNKEALDRVIEIYKRGTQLVENDVDTILKWLDDAEEDQRWRNSHC